MPSLHNPQDKQELQIQLKELAEEKFGFVPYEWQIDITVAILHGQDTICIAGTGSGKTLLFALPGLLTGKVTLVLSPLNALEEDQALRFKRQGLRALALNSENFEKSRLESKPWKPLLSNTKFLEQLGLVAIDEAHCIPQWGQSSGKEKAFRPAWGDIGNICSLVPSTVPFLAVSATLPPTVLTEV
ncbi:hypothetical protein BOTBODRAFT_117487 [Botryobasidium botryosum FD-172 SS1]|uniref:DNA 3'-5' helicase n=1 Tax=Botryobasidium botryosum (strain FD-172 SS1) TaxID=930990 RepID=A0A067MBH1_BOTB1|nr:hypothetical protein BOTBODRAFT_117487 [Botryobasidium botryosum FD-172 SS1]